MRVRIALAAACLFAGFAASSNAALAADANCPSAATPICRQWSCTGPVLKPVCSCARWECGIVKDPSKGDAAMSRAGRKQSLLVR